MVQKEAQEAVKKYGSQRAAATALGISRTTFRRIHKGQKSTVQTKFTPSSPAKGKSLTDFRKAYDKDFIVPKKVRDAIKELGSTWEYESVFAKNAGVSLSDLGNYRDMFSDYIVSLKRDGKRAWAGTKQLAQQMREMV